VTDAILQGLTIIAGEWQRLAIAWHGAAALLIAALVVRRATQQWVTSSLTLPLFSVAALAWWAGNPVNTLAFAGTAVALVRAAASFPRMPLVWGRPWEVVSGATLCAFGWVYPHFLAGPWWQYLYQSPLGLIPCPTLAFIVGISVATPSLQSTRWGFLVSSIAAVYGAIGAFVLGVAIDWVLLAGAALLVVRSVVYLQVRREPLMVKAFGRTL
jgi:hypothetical protein